MNNGLMGGYGEYMPQAVEHYDAHRLSGDYAGVATALGAHAERVCEAAELRAAIERCAAAVASGRTALLEVMTHEEPELALG
jgi:thiamine pyrophosphate-dependent acetolactate synthase large subunit-like protein